MSGEIVKEYQNELKKEIEKIFTCSFFDYSFFEPNYEIEGQYWIAQCWYHNEDESGFTDLKKNLSKFIRSDECPAECGNENLFFRNNDEFVNDIYAVFKKNTFKSLISIFENINNKRSNKNESISIIISSRLNSKDNFKNNLFNEDLGFIDYDEKSKKMLFSPELIKRIDVMVPCDTNRNIRVYIPEDKIDHYNIQKHNNDEKEKEM